MKIILEGLIFGVLLVPLASDRLRGEESDEKKSSYLTGDVELKQLISTNKQERESALKNLQMHSGTIRNELVKLLLTEAGKYKEDETYCSPLHCMILAVVAARVFEAEDLLLSILDYELDVASMPVGMVVPGEYLFPPVWALDQLRVEPKKIIPVMGTCKNMRDLRLLTWLLYRRLGAEEAKMFLEREIKIGSSDKKRLLQAIELLDHPKNLLPPLKRARPDAKK